MYSPLSPQTSLSSELRNIINERNMLSMRSRMKGMYKKFIFFYMFNNTVFITLYYNIFSVLHALNEDSERYAEERERTLKSQAIQEILTTEVTYLQQLEILTEVHFNVCLIMKLLKHYS